jgi:Na+-driven multidrug efflux pump
VAVNVVANLVLIPQFGIVGAALASLVSYSTSAAIVLTVASRMSGQSVPSLVLPGREEVRVLVAGARRSLGRVRELASSGGRKPGAQTGEP